MLFDWSFTSANDIDLKIQQLSALTVDIMTNTTSFAAYNQ